MNPFRPEAFFDILQGPASGLLTGMVNVWDAVAALPEYIEKILEPEILGHVEDGAWVEPGAVRLEKGGRVERGAIVRGPTIIGRNTVIRTGAYIRGHVMLGDDCLVGHGTEIRQILVLNRSNIPHLNCVFTSLVGNDVNLGGNTNTANKLLDGREVVIRAEIEGEKKSFPTGQSLFGVVIGDGTQVGGNILFQPGTIVGRHCLLHPRLILSGYIPHNMIVRPKATPLEMIPR